MRKESWWLLNLASVVRILDCFPPDNNRLFLALSFYRSVGCSSPRSFPTSYQSSFFQAVSFSRSVGQTSCQVRLSECLRPWNIALLTSRLSSLFTWAQSASKEKSAKSNIAQIDGQTKIDENGQTGEKRENSLSPLAQRPTLESRLNSDQHIQSFFL